jgi:hypothetical protein
MPQTNSAEAFGGMHHIFRRWGFSSFFEASDAPSRASWPNLTPIKLGVWHTLVLEVQGKSVLASVDGTVVAFGAHDAIDVDKASFAISVSGDSASFKNLRVWEATPNKDWETTRTRLRAGRPR